MRELEIPSLETVDTSVGLWLSNISLSVWTSVASLPTALPQTRLLRNTGPDYRRCSRQDLPSPD